MQEWSGSWRVTYAYLWWWAHTHRVWLSLWQSTKDASWLTCVSYLVLPRPRLDASQRPGDSLRVTERERAQPLRPNTDDGKLNPVLVLCFFSFLFLRGGVSKLTVRAREHLVGLSKRRSTSSFSSFSSSTCCWKKPCVSKAGGYCKKVQSAAFCLRNKLTSTVQLFLFFFSFSLQLPLRCNMYLWYVQATEHSHR